MSGVDKFVRNPKIAGWFLDTLTILVAFFGSSFLHLKYFRLEKTSKFK